MSARRRVKWLALPTGGGRSPIPAHVVQAQEPGPTVVVTANVHGDETTGTGAVLELLPLLQAQLKAGSVVLFPSLNPEGLAQRCRVVPADNKDLNRAWPGEARGGPSERLAHCLWTALVAHSPDLVIDLHADAPSSIPYCIVDRHLRGNRRLIKRALELALATGMTVLQEYPRERYVKFGLERSLSGAVLNRLAIPSLTIEAGPRLVFSPSAVGATVNAVMGVLTKMSMAQIPAPRHPSCLDGGPWRRESGLRVGHAGLLRAHVRPGQVFDRGALLAEIVGLDGQVLERLLSPRQGAVISLPERAWVVAGVAAGTYAVREDAQ